MDKKLLSVLSCNQFLTEHEIKKITNLDCSLEKIHQELEKLETNNLIIHYFFAKRDYWISKQVYQLNELGNTAHQYLVSRKKAQKLHTARTCYHHIGGQLGVRIFENFYNSNKINVLSLDNILLTEKGKQFISASLKLSIPNTAKVCVDFSERRPHFAGKLGNSILRNMVKSNQITPTTNRLLIIKNKEVYNFGK